MQARRAERVEKPAPWSRRGQRAPLGDHGAPVEHQRLLVLSPHPGRVKAELNAGHIGFADMGTPTFDALQRRIHDLLFTDKVETALAPEVHHD